MNIDAQRRADEQLNLQKQKMVGDQAIDLRKQGLEYQLDEGGKPIQDPNTGLLKLTPASEEKQKGLINQSQTKAATEAQTAQAGLLQKQLETQKLGGSLGAGGAQKKIESLTGNDRDDFTQSAKVLSALKTMKAARAAGQSVPAADVEGLENDMQTAMNTGIESHRLLNKRQGNGPTNVEDIKKLWPSPLDSDDEFNRKITNLETNFGNNIKSFGIPPQAAESAGYVQARPLTSKAKGGLIGSLKERLGFGDRGAPSPAAEQPSQAPKPGTVDQGHIFLGGNPADPKNWTKAK